MTKTTAKSSGTTAKVAAKAPAKSAKASKGDLAIETPASKATKPLAEPKAAPAPAKKATKASAPAPKPVSKPAAEKAAPPQSTAPAPAQASVKKADSAVPAPKTSTNMPTIAPTKVDTILANAWKHKSGRELSEPELMAMPDSEYMNEKQQDFFRAKLEALKDELLSAAGETTEHLREDTSIVPDPADRATIEEEHALELRTRDRERKLLKKISQALARLESGDYGFCDETGEPIGLGRLIARPTATLSLEAQQRRELKQKMFGD